MKRVIVLSVIWTTILIVLPISYLQLQSPAPPPHYPTPQPPPPTGAPPSTILLATAVVVIIFVVDVAILWILKKIGGRLKADVKATIERFGGSIFIAGAGLVGCFLAIAVVAFAGIFLVTKLLS